MCVCVSVFVWDRTLQDVIDGVEGRGGEKAGRQAGVKHNRTGRRDACSVDCLLHHFGELFACGVGCERYAWMGRPTLALYPGLVSQTRLRAYVTYLSSSADEFELEHEY